jgi:hypothetical protein
VSVGGVFGGGGGGVLMVQQDGLQVPSDPSEDLCLPLHTPCHTLHVSMHIT